MFETFLTVIAVIGLVISGLNIYNAVTYTPSDSERMLMKYAELMGENPIIDVLRKYILIFIVCLAWIAVWYFK